MNVVVAIDMRRFSSKKLNKFINLRIQLLFNLILMKCICLLGNFKYFGLSHELSV
jgi:hypothetical protein